MIKITFLKNKNQIKPNNKIKDQLDHMVYFLFLLPMNKYSIYITLVRFFIVIFLTKKLKINP